MTVAQVIEQAQAAGLALSVDGGKLKVKGRRSPEYDTIVSLIKPMKADVILALTSVKPTAEDHPQQVPLESATVADLTFTLANVDVLPIDPPPPIRNYTGKPLLPTALWVSGLATFAEAWRIEGGLYGQYATSVGQDSGGFYVRCPGWQYPTL